jgi:hypothetical protein
MLVRVSVSCTFMVMMNKYRDASWLSLKPTGCAEMPVISP